MNLKLAIFGDSISSGVTLDAVSGRYTHLQDSYAHLLEREAGVEVLNRSKFGSTVVKGYETAEKQGDKLPDWDFALLAYGGNDCNFDWHAVAEAPDAPHDCATPMAVFTDTYRRLVAFVREHGTKPLMLSMAPLVSDRYFKWIARTEDGDAVMRFLRVPERIARWNEYYNYAVWRVAEALKVPLIDIRSAFLRVRDYAELFCEDGIHPSAAGQRLIYETVAGALGGLAAPTAAHV